MLCVSITANDYHEIKTRHVSLIIDQRLPTGRLLSPVSDLWQVGCYQRVSDLLQVGGVYQVLMNRSYTIYYSLIETTLLSEL
jgi:hypothetical protein